MKLTLLDNAAELRARFFERFVMTWEEFQRSRADRIAKLAEKGYTLLKGRDGKGKLVILIVAVAFGVLLGTFAAQAVDWYRSIAEFYPDAVITLEGEEYLVTYSDIPVLIFYFLGADTEYLLGTLKDIGMGLLFAYMGVFGILKNTAKKVKANKENSSVEM